MGGQTHRWRQHYLPHPAVVSYKQIDSMLQWVRTVIHLRIRTTHPPPPPPHPVTTWISSVRLLLFLLPCSTFFNVTFSLKQRRLYLQLTSEESKQFRNDFYFCTTRSFTYKNYRVAQILYGNGKTCGVTYMATVISLTHLLFISSVLVDM